MGVASFAASGNQTCDFLGIKGSEVAEAYSMSATTHPGYATLADPLSGLRRKEGAARFLFFYPSMREAERGVTGVASSG